MKIKICGLTSTADVQSVNENQVDFAGFVLFFPKSKRNLTIEQVRALLPTLNPTIASVAVVVSPTLEQIQAIEEVGFHYIQIHGDLPMDLLHEIHIPILRAFNVSNMSDYDKYKEEPQIVGYVFDAVEPGSGQTFDWSLAKNIPRDDKLFLLAGGLHSDNVIAAVTALHPDGVDCSSGVEYANQPGKDPDKVKAFVTAVREIQ